MKFLVILICLLINHFWRKERFLPGSSWLSSYTSGVRRLFARLPGLLAHPLLLVLVLLLIPSLALYGLIWLAEDLLLGLLTVLLHIVVVLLALDRVSMVDLVQRYLTHWRAGDYEGAYLLLQRQSDGRVEGSFAGYAGLHRKFCQMLLASYFERLFVVVFWYMLLGPVGVLWYALARCLACMEGVQGAVSWQQDSGAAGLVSKLIFIFEWAPARLLSLTFSMAGDFVASFSRLRDRFLSLVPGLDLVKICALAALGSVSVRLQAAFECSRVIDPSMFDGESYPQWAARQLEELLSLLQRSQVIWISVLALLTLYEAGL